MSLLRRSCLLLTMALSVLTALSLIYAASIVALPVGGIASEGESVSAVRSFYDAINAALSLGDATALAQVAPAEMIARGTTSSATIHRDQLVEHVMALHAAYPLLHITVDDMMAENERVLARIDVGGADGQGLLGVSVPSVYPGTMMESFRVQDGMIVEYQGMLADLVPPSQMLQESIGLSGVQQLIEVTRLTIAPDAHLKGQVTGGPTVIAVEGGTVTVSVMGKSEIRRAATSSPPVERESTSAGRVSTLGRGDQIAMSTLTGYALHSTANTPAVLIVATVMRVRPQSGPSPDSDQTPPATPDPSNARPKHDARSSLGRTLSQPGVEHRHLLPTLPLSLPTSPVSIAIWQITLAPGMTISGAPPAGAAYAIVVSGQAVFELSTASSQGEMVVISGGEPASLDSGTLAKVQNIGDTPAVLFILTARPTNESATVAGRDPQADLPFSYCEHDGRNCRGH